MDADLLGSLHALTEEASRTRARLLHAAAKGRDVSDGTDESGTITIVIDAAGTARDIRVAADWRSRLAPARIGAAVVAADTAAATGRAAATAQALAEPASTLDSPGSERGGPAVPGWLSPVAAPDGQRRSLEELSRAVWAALDDLSRVSEPPPPVRGCGAHGAVRITMTRGRITECTINQSWLARQDELTLAHALREAVSAAATAGIAAAAPFMDYQRRLHEIITDARAAIEQLRPGDAR